MENVELKPCPFCGEDGITKNVMSRGRWRVVCENCGGRTADYLDRNDAIKEWNRRMSHGDNE